jgi:hypothetical protein
MLVGQQAGGTRVIGHRRKSSDPRIYALQE